MAVWQRTLNSTTPFSGSALVELKGARSSWPTSSEQKTENKEQNESKVDLMASNPVLTKLLTHGTAEQVGEGPLKNSNFIAQAVCETQDSQAFSPSCSERSYVASPNCFISRPSSEHNNVACQATASIQSSLSRQTARKKTRKRQKRKEKKKEEKRESGKQGQRRRVPSGVPEQESGSAPLIQIQGNFGELHRRRSINSSSCSSSVQSSEVQDTGPPQYSRQAQKGLSCTPWTWDPQVFDCGFSHHSSYGQESELDSSLSEEDCALALAGLRGSVSQGDPCYAFPFFRDVQKDVREEEEEEKSVSDSVFNEGLIFHEKIQPVDSEYKEGQEYHLSWFIKRGSYGEVHRAQDFKTGFVFAAKKIPLKSFNSEEVGAWSALRSPRVVELFGVVREGPYVILFMDHKSGSLGQLLAERGRLPEDLALYYHGQVLGALEHLLKRRVVHLDVKVDNVLLSEDGKDTFLCDFGHSERLNSHGQSINVSTDLKGTYTHMAPEIVKGEARGAKSDVWSSCCMLLHMLNGCQPWTRYYNCLLYLKIANEPAPLHEIPPDCSSFTADVIKAGLQKDPITRASAPVLKEVNARALKAVGGLSSSFRGPYREPLHQVNHLPTNTAPFEEEEGHPTLEDKLTSQRSWETELDTNDAEEDKGTDSEDELPPLVSQFCLQEQKHDTGNGTFTVPELEMSKLERDFFLSSLSQLHSAEIQEQLLSCLSSDCHSSWDPCDKKDSGRWSILPGDDLSSGVFSNNSQPEGQVFSMDWLGNTHQPPSRYFEGVDICIRNFQRQSIQIRETRRVKVSRVATGISNQISERVFTLETQDGQPVGHDDEVQDSGLLLRCVSAPDYSPAWRWRVKDGQLETRD
ncbi:mitogen-activated protein kinase kinase kinase 14 [Aplochiton taeniatus]